MERRVCFLCSFSADSIVRLCKVFLDKKYGFNRSLILVKKVFVCSVLVTLTVTHKRCSEDCREKNMPSSSSMFSIVSYDNDVDNNDDGDDDGILHAHTRQNTPHSAIH